MQLIRAFPLMNTADSIYVFAFPWFRFTLTDLTDNFSTDSKQCLTGWRQLLSATGTNQQMKSKYGCSRDHGDSKSCSLTYKINKDNPLSHMSYHGTIFLGMTCPCKNQAGWPFLCPYRNVGVRAQGNQNPEVKIGLRSLKTTTRFISAICWVKTHFFVAIWENQHYILKLRKPLSLIDRNFRKTAPQRKKKYA